MRLTARDRQIIRLVHRHRFLRSSHIVALIGGSSQQILRRLQLLYHHGYLERPRAQIDYHQYGGSHHMVYGIGNKGAALLKEEFSIPFDQLNWSAKNHSVGRIFIEHALLVSDIMVRIELACRENGRIRLLWGDELACSSTISRNRQQFKWKITVSNGVKVGIIPDRVFALESSGAGGNRDCAFFFLEADRGTMPVIRRRLSQTSFFRKLLAYESTWSQSIHRTRFGFHRFRVLTVTTSDKRMRVLANACAQLKSGHGLFLFTDRSFLDVPTDIFSLAWHTARPGETTTLLN
jgi:DNA-binding Lrp family transcriptional regulator